MEILDFQLARVVIRHFEGSNGFCRWEDLSDVMVVRILKSVSILTSKKVFLYLYCVATLAACSTPFLRAVEVRAQVTEDIAQCLGSRIHQEEVFASKITGISKLTLTSLKCVVNFQ
jgi:hypothetical protein